VAQWSRLEFAEVSVLPVVTVGIPTYRRPRLLQQAVASAISQTNQNISVAIGNNDVEHPITKKSVGFAGCEKLTIYNHKTNLGQIGNMEFLLSVCRTQWFTWLNDDDLMHPRCIELLLDAVRKLPSEPVAVYCNYWSTPEPGPFADAQVSDVCAFGPKEFILKYSKQHIPLLGVYGLLDCRALKRTQALHALGSASSLYSDTLVPLVLASQGQIAHVDQKLFVLRTHSGSLSVSSVESDAYLSAQRDFLDVVTETCSEVLDRKAMQDCLSNLLRWFARDYWHVLMRSSPQTRGRNALTLAKRQIHAHLARLEPKRRLGFLLFLLHLVTKKLRYDCRTIVSQLLRAKGERNNQKHNKQE